jgi:transposase
MSGTNYHRQHAIRLWLGLYLEDNGVTSMRKIAEFLKEKINEDVSPSTIARLVKEYGWGMKKGEWVKK